MLESQGGDADPHAENLYIEIPDPVMPLERGKKDEDPLAKTLTTEHAFGTVTGDGSMMNTDNSIDYGGLDVTV